MADNKVQHYDPELQKLYISFMVSDPELFSKSLPIIKADYWDPKFKKVVRYMLDFYEEYRHIPNIEQINANTQIKLDFIQDTALNTEWFIDEIEQFCRHKAMEMLIYDGPGLLEEGHYSEIENRAKENMAITINTDMGLDYFSNPYQRLQQMVKNSDMTPTGWSDIDKKLYGGMNRGELTIFAGGPGSGKSLFLQNLALNWVQMGLDIVYITLELSEHLVGLRFDAMIAERSTKEIFKDLEETSLKVAFAKKTHNWGNLTIRKFPQGGTRCIDLRAYLKEYIIQHGKKPDGILVDYLDLIHPNSARIDPSNLFAKDKYVSEELRGLADEFGILMASASQLGRTAVQEQTFDISHIAGGISKVNTADNVLAIYVTPQMKENGQYQIQFIKTRSSAGVGSHVFLKYYPEFMRITSAVDQETEQQAVTSKADYLKQQLLRRSAEVKAEEPQEETEQKAVGVRKGLGELAALTRNNLKRIND